MAYANGQYPASAIALIPGTQQYIRKDLVGAVTALRAAFQERFGKPLQVTDGYRPYSVQERIFRQRYTTNYARSAKIDHRIWQGLSWWRLPGYASASTPGRSNHGWGQAIDFGSGVNTSLTSAEHRWMRDNAPRYGWTHPEWARKSPYLEPWHWEGVPVAGFANNPGAGSGSSDLPDPDTGSIDPLNPIGENMSEARIRREDGAIFYARIDSAGGAFVALDPTANAAVDKMGIRVTKDNLTRVEVQQIRQAVIDLSKKRIDNA